MHPATITALYGMIGLVRQALNNMEAILSAEESVNKMKQQQAHNLQENSAGGQESHYMSEEQEKALELELERMYSPQEESNNVQ